MLTFTPRSHRLIEEDGEDDQDEVEGKSGDDGGQQQVAEDAALGVPRQLLEGDKDHQYGQPFEQTYTR